MPSELRSVSHQEVFKTAEVQRIPSSACPFALHEDQEEEGQEAKKKEREEEEEEEETVS